MAKPTGSGESFLHTLWRYGRWPLGAVVLMYVALVANEFVIIVQQTPKTVAEIQAQNLTMADADGSHLPPTPDPKLVDATIAGVDANNNGIRDDVELAIFKKYPGTTNLKIRAAELQYAMALQTELTMVSNTQTWVAFATQESRGYACISSAFSRSDLEAHSQAVDKATAEVETLVFDTSNREKVRAKADTYTTTFSLPSTNLCDL